MYWLALFLFSVVILVLGIIYIYFYFKFKKVITIYNVLLFIISKLTLVFVLFYFTPLWKIIAVHVFDIDPALITSPPLLAFLSYVVALIVITYLFIQMDAKKAIQLFKEQQHIET
jgi:hypothetical protein